MAAGQMNDFYPATLEIMEELYDEDFEPSEKDVLEQCKAMGIDPVKEEDLKYIAVEALKAPLPDQWKPVADGHEGIFYHNFITGESTWEHPCDQFYLQMLKQERAKRASQSTALSSTSSSHGPPVGRVPVNNSPKMTPSLGPVKAPTLPLAPLSTAPLKKPALAPIGAAPQLMQQGLDPVSTLPPLKGSTLGSLNPLFANPLPAIKQSTTNTVPSPQVAISTPLAVDKPSVLPPAGIDSMRTPAEGGVVSKGSSHKELGDRPGTNPFLGDLDLHVGHISTEFKEEEEDEESEESEEEESLEKTDTFDKKFNIKGLRDVSGSFNSSDNKELLGESEGEERVKKPLLADEMESSDDENEMPHPVLTLTNQTPGLSALSSKSRPPNLVPISHSPAVAVTAVVPSADTIPPPLSQISSSISTGAAVKQATARERADLEKNHYSTLERLREEHAEQLKKLMEQFAKELEEEKSSLCEENERKMATFKQQEELKATKKRERLKEEHEQALSVMKKEYEEKQDDEEALLEEKKQTILRNMKKKIDLDQQEQEKQLKTKRDESLKEMESKLCASKLEEERKLQDKHNEELEATRAELLAERERKKKELEETTAKELEAIKGRNSSDLNKVKQELETEHQQTLAATRESLSAQHKEALETLRLALQEDFKMKKNQLEEQGTFHSTLEEETQSSWEARRKQLQEEHDKVEVDLKASFDEQLQELKQSHEEKLEEERKRHETELKREQQTHQEVLEREKRSHRETLEGERKRNEEELTKLKQTHSSSIQLEKVTYQEKLKQVKINHSSELEKEKLQFEQELTVSKRDKETEPKDIGVQSEGNDDEIAALQEKQRLELAELAFKLEREKSENERLRSDIKNMTAVATSLHQPIIDKQDSEHTTLHVHRDKHHVSSSTSRQSASSNMELTEIKLKVQEQENQLSDLKAVHQTLLTDVDKLRHKLLNDNITSRSIQVNLSNGGRHANLSTSSHSKDDSTIIETEQEVTDQEREDETITKLRVPLKLSSSHVKSHDSLETRLPEDVIPARMTERRVTDDKHVLFVRIQSKLDKEAAAIRDFESRLNKRDKRVSEFNQQLLEEIHEADQACDDSFSATAANDEGHSCDNSEGSSDPLIEEPTVDREVSCSSSTSAKITRLRSQLLKEGLIEAEPHSHARNKSQSHSHEPRSRSRRPRSHSSNAGRKGTRRKCGLRIEDLQDSSGVSSTSELSSGDSGTNLLQSDTPPPSLHHLYSASSSDLLPQLSSPPAMKQPTTDPLVSGRLEQINTQLGELLDRLNERQTPLVVGPDRSRWADPVHPSPSLHLPPPLLPVHSLPPSMLPPGQSSFPSHLDVSLHQRWKEYLNAAAANKSTANSAAGLVYSPPLPLTKLDQEGRELIRKHRDWLGEFRQSLPKSRS